MTISGVVHFGTNTLRACAAGTTGLRDASASRNINHGRMMMRSSMMNMKLMMIQIAVMMQTKVKTVSDIGRG